MLEAFLTALILAILKCILFKGRVRDCTEVTEGKIHRQENTKTRPTIVYNYKGKLYRSTINHVFSEGIITETRVRSGGIRLCHPRYDLFSVRCLEKEKNPGRGNAMT